MNEMWILMFIILIVIVLVSTSLKIANEDERFAVFTLGRFAAFRGPGLIITPFAISKVCRLKVGDEGVLASSEFARFGEFTIPVTNTDSLAVGQAVRIDGFEDTEPRLAASL